MSEFDISELASTSFVRSIHFQPEMPSTNDWALANCTLDSHAYPLIVLTDRQTAGRGRGANRWKSSAGSLTFSVVLSLEGELASFESRRLLPLGAGLAVAQAVFQLTGQECFIKWPNDVMLQDRKLAGILVETVGEKVAVLGMGVNVSNTLQEGEQISAISLRSETGKEVALQEFLLVLLSTLEKQIGSIAGGDHRWIDEVRDRCWLRGKTVSVEFGQDKKLVGRVAGLQDCGGLQIETESGTRTIYSGTIRLV